jgi:nicotinamide-nucleotide amidase
MRAEIISIGTELLLGDIIDTNAAWLAQQLATVGVDLYFRTTVGDNVQRIAEAIRLALSRADVVITSGGLGPTVDDMTREAVARATERDLVLDEGLLAQIRAIFGKWGRTMTDNNVRQAYIPRGATPFANPVGTAPIFRVDHEGKYVFVLPGVPREMKYLTETVLLPWLKTLTGGEQIILSKTLRTCAVGESQVDARITDLEESTNPTVGLLAHPGQTDVRITAKAGTRAEAERLIKEMEAKVRERLGDWIYGEGSETVPEVVARLLVAKNLRIALGETNTEGMIAQRLRDTPEGERIVAGAESRQDVREISADYAKAWANELRTRTGADVALVAAGSMDGSHDMYSDNTGLTAIAVADEEGSLVRTHSIGGTGELSQNWVVMRALDLLRRRILRTS